MRPKEIPAPNVVVITGLGMISSLGSDVATCCAAARAGISRSAPLEEASVYDEETGELIPVVGHHSVAAKGFSGLGRVVRLGQKALQDLFLNASAGIRGLPPITVVCAVSSRHYWSAHHAEQLASIAQSLPFDPAEAIDFETRKREEEFGSGLVTRLSAASSIPLNVPGSRIYFGEQAAVAMSLDDAIEHLQSGKLSICLVGGIDSLVDQAMLEALAGLDILKTPAVPVGLIPGEAAAFVLLETYEHAHRRRASILASVEKPKLQRAGERRFSPAPINGRALATVISQAARTDSDNGSPSCLLIGNLNGDTWRAREWGSALAQLPPGLRAAPMWSPAEYFGEVGAASGAVAVCLGATAFSRGYAHAAEIIIWLSGDDGVKAGFLLRHWTN